jgi:hypothetical protein
MAIAFVALLAALSGSAIALPGSNGVNSGDVKNNSLASKDIKNNSLTGKDLRNGRVGSADVKNDGLTGTDINEGTLATVPSANVANSAAVANQANAAGAGTIRKLNYRAVDDAAPATVFNEAGVSIVASCPGGTATLEATSGTSTGLARVTTANLSQSVDSAADDDGTRVVEYEEVDTFESGDTIDMLPADFGGDGTDSIQGSASFVMSNNAVITIDYMSEEGANLADCVLAGTAIVAP